MPKTKMTLCFECGGAKAKQWRNDPNIDPSLKGSKNPALPKYCDNCFQRMKRAKDKKDRNPFTGLTIWHEKKARRAIKRTLNYRDRAGHVALIHRGTFRWAKKEHQDDNFISVQELKRWSMVDGTYYLLFNTWEENDFHDDYCPMLTRRKYPGEYKLGNLYWTPKKIVGIGITQKKAAAQRKAIIKDIAKTNAATIEKRRRSRTPAEKEEIRARVLAAEAREEAFRKKLRGVN